MTKIKYILERNRVVVVLLCFIEPVVGGLGRGLLIKGLLTWGFRPNCISHPPLPLGHEFLQALEFVDASSACVAIMVADCSAAGIRRMLVLAALLRLSNAFTAPACGLTQHFGSNALRCHHQLRRGQRGGSDGTFLLQRQDAGRSSTGRRLPGLLMAADTQERVQKILPLYDGTSSLRA